MCPYSNYSIIHWYRLIFALLPHPRLDDITFAVPDLDRLNAAAAQASNNEDDNDDKGSHGSGEDPDGESRGDSVEAEEGGEGNENASNNLLGVDSYEETGGSHNSMLQYLSSVHQNSKSEHGSYESNTHVEVNRMEML